MDRRARKERRTERGSDNIAIDAGRNPSIETSFSKWLSTAAREGVKASRAHIDAAELLERSRMTHTGFSRGEKVTRLVPNISCAHTPLF